MAAQTGSGPPVVLCNGTPFVGHLAPLRGALSSDHAVYVWDIPGYAPAALADEIRVWRRAPGAAAR